MTKIAIVHDYLCGIGGSERVFQYICEEFIEAEIYTLSINRSRTLDYFKNKHINTTYLNPFVRSMQMFRWFFPVSIFAIRTFNFDKYDIVLTSCATVAKYINVKNGRHICYCYIPTRALWQNDDYFKKSLIKYFFKPFLSFLRKKDLEAASKVDKFIAISEDTKKHIKLTYFKDSEVLNCPIDLKMFYKSANKSDNYLIVSRLENWKMIDYAIHAFNIINLPLKIIGTGKEESRLKRISNSNISFLGEVNDDVLAYEYSVAKAVIFTPSLEYGLVPLESVASGTPVIAYGVGGILETMIPYNDNNFNDSINKPTALFYYEQTTQALIESINKFNDLKFDSDYLISYAKKWSVSEFQINLRKIVMSNL